MNSQYLPRSRAGGYTYAVKLKRIAIWSLACLACFGTKSWKDRALSAQEPASADAQAYPDSSTDPEKPVKKIRVRKSKAKKKKAATTVKKKVKAKPAYDYKKSKYKALMNEPASTYRFDSQGNPVKPDNSKKSSTRPMSGAADSAPAVSGEDSSGETQGCSGDSCQ